MGARSGRTDLAYAVEVSDGPVPLHLQLWLGSVFSLAERTTDLTAATLSAKRRALERQLSAILSAPIRCDLTRALQANIGRSRDQLLVFLDYPGRVAVTNNGCERAPAPGGGAAEGDERLSGDVGGRG